MGSWIIAGVLLQGLLYVGISPLVVGMLRWVKARLQGRQGSRPTQPYRDLLKLFRRRPVVPATASFVFSAAPWIVFTCYAFLGILLPVVFLPPNVPHLGGFPEWPIADLLILVYLLGLTRFVIGLAGMDAGAPFGGLGAGREMFMNFLVEPTLILVIYALALEARTTSLPAILNVLRSLGAGLYFRPGLWLAFLALALVALIETGRIPIDNPHTHLELTMMGKAIHLEYAGRHLAMLEWAEAMRLTFFLSLFLNLFLPYFMAAPDRSLLVNLALVLAYPYKLFAMVLLLAAWELSRAKLRLRAVVGPAGMALLFSCLAVAVVVLSR